MVGHRRVFLSALMIASSRSAVLVCLQHKHFPRCSRRSTRAREVRAVSPSVFFSLPLWTSPRLLAARSDTFRDMESWLRDLLTQIDDATTKLTAAAGGLTDEQVSEPSLLPGWTR